ncbi:MAG: lytic transglycosylase domain-containing protein [Spirochaetales bacterium]|nr:lytic transglycosylase domain-containing protein [Spirochaetales bacterium]
MQTSAFLSQTSKLILAAVISLFTLSFPQCKGETFLGLSRGELERKLTAGDYSFLDKVDVSAPPGAEILSFAPGAGYCFGLAARERGRIDLFVRFLELEMKSGAAPYRHWAAGDLLTHLNDSGHYEKTEALAESYLEKNPDSPFRNRVRFLLVESFYWRKDDRETLARIEKYFPGGGAALAAIDPELFLFKAVASCRLGLPDWETIVRNFFRTVRASALHVRFHTFLAQEKEKLAAFTPFERDVFEAVSLEGDGRHREAAARFERLLPHLAPAALSGTALAADFTSAALGGSPSGRQAFLLIAFSKKAAGEEKASLLEAAGRIYLAAGDYGRSRSTQEAALALSADPQLVKRVLYRLIRIGLNRGAEAGLAAVRTWGPRIAFPDYYADEADELLNLLMRERKYRLLLSLAESPPSWFPPGEKASLAYITARLLAENLVPGGGDKAAAISSFFRAARADSPRGYYGFLAAHFLNEQSKAEAAFTKNAPVNPSPRPKAMNDAELLADRYLDFGLYRRAFSIIGDGASGVTTQCLAWWADRLARRGRPYEAIQTLSVFLARETAPLSRAQIEILYPRAFAAIITPAAAEFGLDERLFFSLVRQESAFHSGIASQAGAVGLTQLMPDTGAWIASQLKAGAFDLAEPATNVRFGAYYLSFLRARLDSVPYVLAGYNAGPNAARRWKLTYGRLPDDLAVESFDYAETRDFIKSIFSGRVVYGLLYGNAGIKETARLFYNF